MQSWIQMYSVLSGHLLSLSASDKIDQMYYEYNYQLWKLTKDSNCFNLLAMKADLTIELN